MRVLPLMEASVAQAQDAPRWMHRGRPAVQLEMIPGETDLAIDEMPEEAEAEDAIAIIEDIRHEATAAVMRQSDLPRGIDATVRGLGSPYPPRRPGLREREE